MKKVLAVLCVFFLTVATVAAQKTTDPSAKDTSKDETPDAVKRAQSAANVLQEIMDAKDNSIPDNILSGAECVAVVPGMFKAGIGIGGRYGKGVASCRTPKGWSAPAPITIAGGSWGLQIGAEAIDLVMLVMNEKGMQHLLSSKFKIGGDASASAGPVGRTASAETDWKMKSEVLTYSRSRGVFAGVSLDGAAIKQDRDATQVLYGKILPFDRILRGGVAAPQSVHSFIATLDKYSPRKQETESRKASGAGRQ